MSAVNTIYPRKSHSNKILHFLMHKPLLFTVLSPIYGLIFLASVVLAVAVSPWLIFRMVTGLLYGDPISLPGVLTTILFLVVFVLIIIYFSLIPYRIYRLYNDDTIMVAFSDGSLILRKNFYDIELDFEKIESIDIEKNKSDRYYGEFNEVSILTTNGQRERFIFTISVKFVGLPIWLPSKSKQGMFEGFLQHLKSSSLSDRVV